ncbi:hypothetical protein P5673_022156 [Acropora cervicornis]|uniref:Uncharacterized protein n=1 Tax=Acropora cervicornis TaxID=6130 RepID=A0AAD9Q707_ACRCE|nr:hypothetical protein P5673_022156 [Acropora cervicornis]
MIHVSLNKVLNLQPRRVALKKSLSMGAVIAILSKVVQRSPLRIACLYQLRRRLLEGIHEEMKLASVQGKRYLNILLGLVQQTCL